MDSNTIREVLIRAEEIRSTNALELQSEMEVDQIVRAAEEAGLPKEAVLQALRERVVAIKGSGQPGQFVFAKAGEGHHYVARLIQENEGGWELKFLNGSTAFLPYGEIQPMHLLPGSKVWANWPNWGWWKCNVLNFDQENLKVTVDDGMGSEKTFHLAEVRLNRKRTPTDSRLKYWVTQAAIALGSGAVGILIYRLLTR